MAVTYNTVIDQGADWYITFYYDNPDGSPVNISGYTAALQMRTSPLAKTTVLSLSTGGNGIQINGPQGRIDVHATNVQTSAITNGKYSYDLEITSPQNVVTRLVQGTIEVSPQTTRT